MDDGSNNLLMTINKKLFVSIFCVLKTMENTKTSKFEITTILCSLCFLSHNFFYKKKEPNRILFFFLKNN